MSIPVVSLQHAAIKQGDRTVLHGVDLDIAAGEFVYLVGRTGAGKTSLLKTLYAALPLGGGRGRVTDYDLEKVSRRKIPQLRRKLGIVFQDFNLLTDRSVADNLNFALRATGWRKKAAIERRIDEVLTSVDLLARKKSMPHTLSGGEQQRVAFARALLNKPQLLIADEVTGNLDPDTSREVLQLMRDLATENHSAVLFATHDYRLLDTFQARVVRCEAGQVFNAQ